MLLVFVNRKPHQNPYLAVITCEDDHAEQMARDFLAATVEKSVVKSKPSPGIRSSSTTKSRLKGSDTSFVNGLTGISGVTSAVLVSYNGVYGVNGASLGQRIPGQLKHTKDRWPKKGENSNYVQKASASISSVW